MTDYETFFENLTLIPWFTSDNDPTNIHRKKAAPILFTLVLLHNNRQKNENKIYRLDKSSRNEFNKYQLHTANRVIQGIRSLQGYDYPKRFSIIDKDPAKEEGDRFCFLFSNQTDDNYTGDTETGVTDTQVTDTQVTDTQVTDTQVTDTQTVVDTQSSFSVHDSKNSRVLASTDEDEKLSVNELMQRLQKNLEKNYPKFVKLRLFFQVDKSNIKSSSQIDQVTRDSRNMYADRLPKDHAYRKDIARAVQDLAKGDVRFQPMDEKNGWKFGMVREKSDKMKNQENTENPKDKNNDKNKTSTTDKILKRNSNKAPVSAEMQSIQKAHKEFKNSQKSQNSQKSPNSQKSQNSKKSIIDVSSDSDSKSSQINTLKPPFEMLGTPEPIPLFRRKQLVPQTPELQKQFPEHKQGPKGNLTKSINQSSFITTCKKASLPPPKITDTPRVGKKMVKTANVQKESREKLLLHDGSVDSKLKNTFSTGGAGLNESGRKIMVSVAGFDDKTTKSSATFGEKNRKM